MGCAYYKRIEQETDKMSQNLIKQLKNIHIQLINIPEKYQHISSFSEIGRGNANDNIFMLHMADMILCQVLNTLIWNEEGGK